MPSASLDLKVPTIPYSVNIARNFISFYSQGESISVFRTNTKYTSSVT